MSDLGNTAEQMKANMKRMLHRNTGILEKFDQEHDQGTRSSHARTLGLLTLLAELDR